MNEQRHWISHWESLSNPNETVASCMVGHLQHLFDPEATWTFEACRLSIAAATHEAAETRIAAVDAMAQAIERSLVIPETLAQAFFCTLEQTKLNRVCKCFEDIAQHFTAASVRHRSHN